jgi:tRNA(adenine34) deaminase
MKRNDLDASDLRLMRRCIALAESGLSNGEYPFAAVVARRGEFICEASNMVRRERDATRHAEMVALSAAQHKLSSSHLDDCTLYSTIEPCAMCSYAIRESRIGKVMFGLRSPVMGGHSRWNILSDEKLSSVMPEVFAPPPDVLAGCLHEEVQKLFRRQHPLAWHFIERRRIFIEQADHEMNVINVRPAPGLKQRFARWARSRVFDQLWRD